MNKIPKCSRRMIPKMKANKKSNDGLNINKLKILKNKSNTKSFCSDITNLSKNKEINTTKKSSSFNAKVNICIYNNFIFQKHNRNNIPNNHNNFFQRPIFINNNSTNFPSLNNTLNALSGNRTFNLGKNSCELKVKNNLESKNISINYNLEKELNNFHNNTMKTNRPNNSLNIGYQKTIQINRKNNSLDKEIYRKIPAYKKRDKFPNKLTFSNNNLM